MGTEAVRINLITDAPHHNLALMKIAAYHKQQDDIVTLNWPLDPRTDLTYGSWLFSKPLYACDVAGGPGDESLVANKLPPYFDVRPDYDLFHLDYSLGYTWRYCPRRCRFCVVPKQNNPKVHNSIWDFHDSRFSKICLLNNNTFSDPQWRDTFAQIWDAKLTVIDHGFDLRLLDQEKAQALAMTRFDGFIHFAWDIITDESMIRQGLELARHYKLHALIYVLVGFDSTRMQDLHRCQVIHDCGFDPYIMPYNGGSVADRQFKRFIDLRMYRHYDSIEAAWHDYRP